MHSYEGAPYPVSPTRRVLELEGFPCTQIKQLSGNAMHLMTQMSWVLYVFSHIRVRQPDSFDTSLPGEYVEISSDSESELGWSGEKRQRRA